jgi:hypothetical protein
MSTDDAWVIRDTPERPAAPGIGIGYLPPRPAERGQVLLPVAAGLAALSAGSLFGVLFTHSSVYGSRYPLYDYLEEATFYGTHAVIMLACSILLLIHRTRAWAAGLMLGLGAVWLAHYYNSALPFEFKQEHDGLAAGLHAAAFVLTMAAAAVALVAVLRQPRPDRRIRPSRSDRIAAVALGLAGAVLLAAAQLANWDALTAHPASGAADPPEYCCGWSSHVDLWAKGALAATAVALPVIALVAVVLRSRILAAGLLIGAAATSLADVARSIVLAANPMEALYGLHYPREIFNGGYVTAQPVVGFWLGLIGILLLTAAGVSRLLLSPRPGPYQAVPVG